LAKMLQSIITVCIKRAITLSKRRLSSGIKI